jgi:ACS family D-galactonate transporter-like MFS transporter
MTEQRKAWLIVGLLFLFMTLNFSDKAIVGLAGVPMMREMGLTTRQFGLVGSSFFFLFSISAVIGGFVANRVQTRWLLLAMAAIWAATQLPMIGSIGFATLLACRITLGAAEGPAYPIALHSLYKWFPDRLRAVPTAVVAQGAGIGLALTLPALNWLIVQYSWHWAFGALGIIGLVWPIAWLLLGAEGKLDEIAPAATPSPSASLQPARIPYRRLVLNGTVLAAYFAGFTHYWALSVGLAWGTPFLVKALGYSQAAAGTISGLTHGVGPIIFMAAAWYSQHLLGDGVASRIARGIFAGACLAIGGLCYIALPYLPTREFAVIVLTLGSAVAAVIAVISQAVVSEFVPVAQRGAVLAIGTAFVTSAGVLAPYVMGDIVEKAANPVEGFFRGYTMIGAIIFAGGVIAMLFIRPEREAERLRRDEMRVPLPAPGLAR